ncbi:RHS repeat-associated core domain-containing protein [Vibrio sp. AND4]|uniref:RHS repeat-associated core domain-containing protein n=1 Tax=Vibrio sp. AND4 TaxID=314289 RepID=UPI00015F351D|nr:RHS repeat-associated core domain-containing protein [Vibrio sp. AND4]EDP59511.1 Peptidase C39, bacteriocin processing [Vibrio sp. AND4]
MNNGRILTLWLAISISLVGCGRETEALDIRQVSPSRIEMDLSTAPTHKQLSEAGQLGGVLAPTHPVEDNLEPESFHLMDLIASDDEQERMAFGQAIQNWNKHQYASASVEFDIFRKKYPNSAWASEATLHMACNARFTGQYSTANQLFNEVIQTNQDSEYSGAQQMVAKAKSRLAVLRLMENNPEEAKTLFAEVVKNAPDWRLRSYASIWLRKLSLLKNQAGGLLDCGTRALAYLLNGDGQFEDSEAVLGYVPDNEAEGFSIEELRQLAVKYGYHALAVKAKVSELAALAEPAILQVSRAATGGKGHYWVLERVEAGQFYIVDPQMNRRFHFSAEQLEKEWQGNAILLSKGASSSVGTALSLEDANSTHGGCCGIQRPPSEGGDPGSEPDDNTPNKEGSNPDKNCRGRGAPIWSVNVINLNLYMTDAPLWYDTTVGPGVEVKLSYNTQSVLAQNEPFGHRWMFNYASYLVVDPGDAVTIFEADGSESVFILNNHGVYQSDRYSSTSLTKSDDGKWLLTYADGSQRIYGVPEGTKALQNFLLAEVDNSGNRVTVGYDKTAKVTHVTDALGQVTSFQYNSSGLIERVDDPFGRYALFEYDKSRNLVAMTDMEGYRASLTYDDDHLVTSLTDARGKTQFYIEPADGIHNNFDAYNPPGTAMWENYRITVTLPTGGKEEYYFDGFHGRSWYVDADHYQEYESEKNNSHYDTPKTIYEFVVPNGRRGEISEITYPDGASFEYKYYSDNKLKSATDPFGQKSEYSWTNNGQLLKSIDSLGRSTQFIYANNGLDLTSIVGPFGDEQFTYDDHHRVTEYTDMDGLTTRYGYDSTGNLISTTDANGVISTFERDAKGRVTSVRVGSEIVRRYGYDEIGRVISNKDAADYETHFEYNKINTLTKIRNAAGRTIQRQFGSCPRVLEKETLPGDRDYQYRYDAQKQLTEVINPAKGSIQIGRSKAGLVTSFTDQNQNQTSFEYTSSGELSKKVYPDGSSLKYEYNKGRIKKVTNARGITKTLHFNKKQQLDKIEYSDQTPSVEYSYNELGLLSEVKDAIGSTRYQYEKNGRLAEIDGPRDNDTITLHYNNLDLLSELYAGGKLNTAYKYDDLGRVVEINALGQRFAYHYDYSPLAFSASVVLPNGVTRKTTLNEKGDLSAILYKSKDGTLADYQYRFDEAGQIAEQTGTPAWFLPRQQSNAKYNELNQITEWNGDDKAFVYDKDGNPIKGLLDDGVPFEAEYDAENRLIKLSFTRGDTKYRETFAYGYDHMLAQYQLYKNKALVEEKQFVRLGLVELQQRNAEGEVVQEYAWDKSAPGGIGGLLVAKTSSDIYTYVYNHLGHVQKVLNASGQVVESYQYTPYGQVEGGDFSQQPFGYSTKRSDFASGLVYFGYRFYSPYQRRWLNRDPLQEQGGINLYAYVNGDPLGYVDPDGRNPILIGIGVGAINGAIGAWVQGGDSDDILVGAYTGAFGGLLSVINPVLGAMVSNAAGQIYVLDRKGRPISCVNLGSVLGAGIGGGAAAGLTAYPGATFLGAQLDLAFSNLGGIVGGLERTRKRR